MSEFFSSHIAALAILTIITCILTITALVIALITLKRTRTMRDTLDTLFAGKKATDLEDVIMDNAKRIEEFDGEIQELFAISNTIHKQAHKGLNKVSLLRFDPFGEGSGNQSFALALLDSTDTGIVVSSFHTREGTRIYAKDICKGKTVKHALTQEEQDAIFQAR
ncbi:MAG: hypothetical protein CR972_03805 [Candidatus Moraniibacteriota bacterium]|nr:MAG: hypothetical protein CR972_03805 [Candidatus Moranbacteria bacterium]